ncbi:MAG: response regulator transcription factor [Sphingosinicella sp.]|nr:response regulator transcription factor [Sphingosinicella sp.]
MTERLRILAVDDEPLALRRLRLLLREMSGVELVGEAGGCEEALAAVHHLRPDILLLDIQMRDGTGFDVVENLAADPMPAIIFVSAFDHYGVKAFDASVVDYVLKPIQLERLRVALDKARTRLASADTGNQVDELRAVVEALRAKVREADGPRYETELWIRKNVTGFSRVSVDNIEWVCSEDDYIRVHTAAGSYLMRGSIRNLESRVDPSEFLRIHRRTLVRKSAIREVRSPRLGKVEVLLQSGERLPAGRVYAKKLRQLIGERAS